MSGDEEPNEFTIIMKVLEIMDKRLQKSNSREITQELPPQFLQIINSTLAGPFVASVRGDLMGDSYSTGQAGAVGPHSKAERMTFQQIWEHTEQGIDIGKLAEELWLLRGHLRQEADTAQEDEAVAELSKAHTAAVDGDGPGAMTHLRKAGQWALDGATAIGTAVAAAVIRAALGV